MAVAQLTAQHMFKAELRRAQRDDVSLRTTLTLPGRGRVDTQLVNISPYGFMARMREDARQGDEVVIAFPGTRQAMATVVWSLAGRLGAEFHEPIGVDDYHALLSDIEQEPGGWEIG